MSYLSSRNSQLEEECATLPSLRAEVERSGKRIELLLVLLGEKEEELEGLMGDMREVKTMYRAHLEELLEKSNPPPPPGLSSSTTTVPSVGVEAGAVAIVSSAVPVGVSTGTEDTISRKSPTHID